MQKQIKIFTFVSACIQITDHSKIMRTLNITILVLLLASGTAFAAPRDGSRNSVTLGAGIPSVEGSLSYARYRSLGCWHLDAACGRQSAGEDTDAITTLTLRAGYRVRLYGTPSKVFCAYLGAGAFGGMPLTALPAAEDGTAPARCLYGLYPEAELEVFPLGHVGIVAGCSYPFNFSGLLWDSRFEARVGLRFLF